MRTDKNLEIVNLTGENLDISYTMIPPKKGCVPELEYRRIGYIGPKPINQIVGAELPGVGYRAIFVIPKEVGKFVHRPDVYYAERVDGGRCVLVPTYNTDKPEANHSIVAQFDDFNYVFPKDTSDDTIAKFITAVYKGNHKSKTGLHAVK